MLNKITFIHYIKPNNRKFNAPKSLELKLICKTNQCLHLTATELNRIVDYWKIIFDREGIKAIVGISNTRFKKKTNKFPIWYNLFWLISHGDEIL